MTDPKKPSDYNKEELQHMVVSRALFFWLIGCSVIFVVGCVTYYYVGPAFGLEGAVGFQLSGLIVAVIIAHYSYRMFKFIGNVGKEDYDEDED